MALCVLCVLCSRGRGGTVSVMLRCCLRCVACRLLAEGLWYEMSERRRDALAEVCRAIPPELAESKAVQACHSEHCSVSFATAR